MKKRVCILVLQAALSTGALRTKAFAEWNVNCIAEDLRAKDQLGWMFGIGKDFDIADAVKADIRFTWTEGGTIYLFGDKMRVIRATLYSKWSAAKWKVSPVLFMHFIQCLKNTAG